MMRLCPPLLSGYKKEHAKVRHLCQVNEQRTWQRYVACLSQDGGSLNID